MEYHIIIILIMLHAQLPSGLIWKILVKINSNKRQLPNDVASLLMLLLQGASYILIAPVTPILLILECEATPVAVFP